MTNPRHIIFMLGLTVLIIGALGLWSAWAEGSFRFSLAPRIEENIVPRALSTNTQSETTMTDTAKSTEANPTVVLKTSAGNITLELFMDAMPITAGNFLALAEQDFYDSTKFHRVIDGFMIQGGDPNSKGEDTGSYGTGGPGYAIEDEFVDDARLSNMRGTISMANAGPGTGGSQFFINLVDNTGLDFNKEPLSSKHPVFGRVISGMEVVEAIAKTPTDARDVPLEPVVVEDVVVG
jgi:cyclophilin family peptidyl-prolyl cis-trans isomerase